LENLLLVGLTRAPDAMFATFLRQLGRGRLLGLNEGKTLVLVDPAINRVGRTFAPPDFAWRVVKTPGKNGPFDVHAGLGPEGGFPDGRAAWRRRL